VNVADGTQIWGEQYNRKMSDIFTVQSDISQEVTDGLHLKLSNPQQQRFKKEYTENVDAYRLYLEGRYYQNRRTKDSFFKAIQSFQNAIAKDPGYALAYAGLADTYALLSNWGFLSPREGYPKAKAAAMKALELDDNLAEAHTSLGSVESGYEWNWDSAERNFKRAIELNPNYSAALHWYAFYLSERGRYEEGITYIRKAQAVDPLSLIINANVGYILYVSRRYDEALAAVKKTLDLDPSFYLAYEYLGYIHEQQKLYDKSVAALQKAKSLSPDNMTIQAELARAYAVAGQKEKARAILNELLETSKSSYVSSFDIANIYIGLGEKDPAMEWLEKAYQGRSDQLAYLKMDPRLDPLRSDSRFIKLLTRVGLS
jgi:tetratricopeptide (TPR) repeat protein